MTRTLHIDLETRSKVDLRKCGVYVYAADPSTDVWCAAYAVDDEPVQLWIPDGEWGDCPTEVIDAADLGYEIVAHNANFERAIWDDVLSIKHGWPLPRLDQWRCTMAMALAMSLPASLENAASALGLESRKDMQGHDTMMRMSKPRRPRKGELPNGTYWFDDNERRERLYAYCMNDVEVERALMKRLLKLTPSEQKLWQLDQVINDRGVHVDVPLCNAALKVVETATKWFNDEMREITDGHVDATTNVGQISAWLREQGYQTASLGKEHIDEMLVRNDLPKDVRRVLEIRREAAKAAVKKIDALLSGRNSDGRARGLLQFHAAGPGRWGGRRFQPHNIKRPELTDIDAAIELVATGSAEAVQLVYGELLAVVGDTLRGMVDAAPGRKIFAADLRNIEGRVTAWISGEEWKLQAFRDFDRGLGPDIYNITAGEILGKAPGAVTKTERQSHGKVPELALGFQGGVGAFQNMAKVYGVDIPDTQADVIKCQWREKHPNTVQTWYDLEDAAKYAISHRGKIANCGPVRFLVAGSFLFLRLPSGRSICYPYPCIKDKLMPWGDMKPSVSFKGIDTFTRKWTDCFAYGGMLMQNIAEGIARDALVAGMNRLVEAGYETGDPARQGIILTVHDEVVVEVDDDFGSLEEFRELMTAPIKWAESLPVAADAFEAQRYRK